MRGPDAFVAYLLDLLAPVGPVAARRMFGAIGLFRGALMFGLVVDEELFLKVGDGNRGAYEAAGEAPFSYATKNGTHTLGSYWRCPAEVLDDTETLQAWARQAIEASVAAGRAKAGGRRRGGGYQSVIGSN